MFRIASIAMTVALLVPFPAFGQYDQDDGSAPFLGRPGNYVYPAVCGACRVWQDYRNFAWNQLDIVGGNARTPRNPGHVTVFRIYTNTSRDKYPAVVVVTLEYVDVENGGTDIGRRPTEPRKYIVETTMDNGDSGDTAIYPPQAGPFPVPYANNGGDDEDESRGGGSPPVGGGGSSGGGDSPPGGGSGGSGSDNGIYGSGGSGGGGPWGGRSGGGTYCGPGTEYECVRL